MLWDIKEGVGNEYDEKLAHPPYQVSIFKYLIVSKSELCIDLSELE